MKNEKTLMAKERRTGKAMLLVVASVLAGAFPFTRSALFAQAGGVGPSAGIPQGTTRQSITDQEIQLMRADLRAERRQIIAANLPLTTEESAKFWPVYDQYIAETIKINDTRYALIKDYAANYSRLTDSKAAEYIRKTMDADKAMIDVRLKYMPMVEKALSERKAAIFVQVDRRVQLMIDLQLASQTPLITPK